MPATIVDVVILAPEVSVFFKVCILCFFFFETVESPTSSDVAEEGKTTFRASAGSLEVAVMVALGPEDCATKVEFATALKRAKEQASVPVKMDPDTRMAAARERVSRLENSLTAMGDFEGVELESLREQKEAQEVLVAVQIREREAFIERARKRIARIDPKVHSVQEAEQAFRASCATQQEQPVGPIATDCGPEVQRLQAIVVELQRQLEHSGGPVTAVGANAARQRSREDFVQLCGGDAAVDLGPPTG